MATSHSSGFFRWGHAQTCFLSVIICLGLAFVLVGVDLGLIAGIDVRVIVATYVFVSALPVVTYWVHARKQKRLPARRDDPQTDGRPTYRHISGTAALWLVGFVVMITAISGWATMLEYKPAISGIFGVGIIGLLLVLFFWFATRSYKPGRPKDAADFGQRGLFGRIGRLFSILDSWLVFPVANAAGLALDQTWQRHVVLIGTLLPVGILGWYLPSPLSFIPLFWAFTIILGVARQWAWVEDDREVAMLNRSFDEAHLRIGFAQDPRDEALIGFAAMLLIIPVALRAVFLSVEPQLAYQAVENAGLSLVDHSYFDWMSLFGTELAKAVPFVDWAEIFRVEGQPFVVLDHDNSAYQWIIFSMRVLVDLVLLAALIQAISIVSRTAKQKQMFFEDGTLSRLDPFVEPLEFRHLARGRPGDWRLRNSDEFEAFPIYSEDHLEVLALPTVAAEDEADISGTEHSAIRFVARCLQVRDEARPPEYLLDLHVRRKEPVEDTWSRLFNAIDTKTEPIDLDRVIRVHEYLNRVGKLVDLRKDLVRLIARNTGEARAVIGLMQILNGSGIVRRERLLQIRVIALDSLRVPASLGNRSAQSALAEACNGDPSGHIQELACRLVNANEHWFAVEKHAKEPTSVGGRDDDDREPKP